MTFYLTTYTFLFCLISSLFESSPLESLKTVHSKSEQSLINLENCPKHIWDANSYGYASWNNMYYLWLLVGGHIEYKGMYDHQQKVVYYIRGYFS